MADDTTASVKITADASGVQPGVDTAKADLSGLLKDGWLVVIQTVETGLLYLVTTVQTAAKMIWDALSLNWTAVANDWQNGLASEAP